MGLAVHILVSIAITYAVLSLVECLVHRFLMHRLTLATRLRSKHLRVTFEKHAVIHHRNCYDTFDRECRSCALVNLSIKPSTSALLAALPCLLALALDPITSLTLLVGGLTNSVAWSSVHAEMHQPRNAWFARTWPYQYLRRAHFLHHRHPGTNFNALYPLCDWIFGTHAKATEADQREMELGTWRVRAPRPSSGS